MEIGVSVTRKCQRGKATFPGVDAKFLVQFPNQRRLGRFAPLDLAAGKFPESRHGLAFGALRKEEAAVPVHQGHGRNEDECHER